MLSSAEDPASDVFVANVICGLGNVRVFQGLWENNDAWLQVALETVASLPESTGRDELIREAYALLTLSEEVARRCKLAHYELGSGEAAKQIILPRETDIYARARTVRFSPHDLAGLAIEREALAAFIHPHQPNIGATGNNSLERHPLIEDGSDLILAIPSAVSLALRARFISRLDEGGDLQYFNAHLSSGQATVLVNDAVWALEARLVEGIQLPPLPPDGPGSA